MLGYLWLSTFVLRSRLETVCRNFDFFMIPFEFLMNPFSKLGQQSKKCKRGKHSYLSPRM